MQHILLLTGCINPNGMPFTSITDNTVRKEQYINAINYYIHKTDFPIVFAENSGTDISSLFLESISEKRLEVITFNGNKKKEKGKGYGEAEIIEYAINNSQIIASMYKDFSIIKITGRLIVYNIAELASKKYILQESDSIIVAYNSDFSLPDSRIIIAPLDFYRSFLLHKEDINDFSHCYFETVLSNCIIHNLEHHYYPFFIEPQITGQSGTTGELYKPYNKDFQRRLKYLDYVYSQILYFDKNFSRIRFSYTKRIIYTVIQLLLKIANKTSSTISFTSEKTFKM